MSTDGALLIAGAGPTGLSAAIELARRGILPRIIDRKGGPTPLSKAVGISPHSLDLLEASGVTERLLARGLRIRRMQLHAGERPLGAFDFSRLPHRFNFLLALPQSDTEAVLAERLREFGVDVGWHCELTSLHFVPGMAPVAMLETPDGIEELRCAQLFGADGAHSVVRGAAGLPFRGYTHRRLWSIADAEIADWPHPPDSAQLFMLGGGNIGFIIPIGAERYRAVANTDDALACIPGRFHVRRVLRSASFHVPARIVPHLDVPNIAVGGDAAHAHSPVGARGMNLGIEDAECFARRYASGTLDGYSAERRPPARRWIAVSESVLAAAQLPFPLAPLRNLLLGTLARVPLAEQPLLARVAGLVE